MPSAAAETVPAGFQARKLPILKSIEASSPKYINGLKRPTTIDFGPDEKMYVGEWLGRVKVFDSVDDTTPTLSVDIATEVHTFGDRGLLGMKLDPEFGETGHNFIYLSYAYDQRWAAPRRPLQSSATVATTARTRKTARSAAG